MSTRPPRSPPPDTLFPYTPLFRSPSSIRLGRMASGLDGQRFAFHGYAPVDPAERAKQLRAWESASHKQEQTQLLIETPYRNEAMFETLKQALKDTTRLCLAR